MKIANLTFFDIVLNLPCNLNPTFIFHESILIHFFLLLSLFGLCYYKIWYRFDKNELNSIVSPLGNQFKVAFVATLILNICV
jgi:hypothetical protein